MILGRQKTVACSLEQNKTEAVRTTSGLWNKIHTKTCNFWRTALEVRLLLGGIRLKFHFLPVAGAAVIGLLIILVSHEMRESSRERQDNGRRNIAEDRLERVAATLSQSVNVRLNHTRSLAAFVGLKRTFTQEEFEIFATQLQQGVVGLRSL